MSRARSTGIRQDPGPVDASVPCADCPTEGNTAVYRVPDPRFDVTTTSALCAYHLSVLKREHPEFWAKLQSHPRLPEIDAHVQEYALVERSDFPESITVDGSQSERLGLDRLGAGYYLRERPDGRLCVIAVAHTFSVQQSTLVREDRLGALFDHVDREVGWRGIGGEWVDRAQAVASGGESA